MFVLQVMQPTTTRNNNTHEEREREKRKEKEEQKKDQKKREYSFRVFKPFIYLGYLTPYEKGG